MSSGNSGYPAGPPGQIARGQLGLCAQGVEPGTCQEVRGGGQRSRARPSSWGGQWGDLVLGGGWGRPDVDFLDRAPGRHRAVDSDPGLSHPALGSPSPVAVIAATMLPPRTALPLTLLLAAGSLGQRARRPSRPLSPISAIQPKANFDAQQVELGGGGGGRRLPRFIGVRPGSPAPSRPPAACPSLQGRGSLWPWPPRVAFCRSRATGLRPPQCRWLPRAQPWPSTPSESCESPAPPGRPASTPAPAPGVAWTGVPRGGRARCASHSTPLGTASAGRCGSSTGPRRSQAASCCKVRRGQWEEGPGLGGGLSRWPGSARLHLPLSSSRRQGASGRGRWGHGLPELRHPVPGTGPEAVGEAVRCVRAGPRAPCTLGPSGRPGSPEAHTHPPGPLLLSGSREVPLQIGPGVGTEPTGTGMGRGQTVAGHVTDMQTLSPEHPAPHPWVPPQESCVSHSPLPPRGRRGPQHL